MWHADLREADAAFARDQVGLIALLHVFGCLKIDLWTPNVHASPDHARIGLDVLLIGAQRKFKPLPGNWVIFYNRPIPNNPISGFLKAVHLRVKPRKDCQCNGE